MTVNRRQMVVLLIVMTLIFVLCLFFVSQQNLELQNRLDDQQQQIRLQLSQVIEVVISQTLLPRINGGRVGAYEVMVANPAVRSLIRDKKVFEIPNIMQLNGNTGMQTLDSALSELVVSGTVSQEEAVMKSSNPEHLKRLLEY